jgi:hypothetical protein
MLGRIGVLLVLAITLTACPDLSHVEDMGISAYVLNNTATPLYVRNNSNRLSGVALVPPGVIGYTGFTEPGEPITWFDAKCHRLGHVAAPDIQAFLVVISGDNTASIEAIDQTDYKKAQILQNAENAPAACYGNAP